MSSSDRNILFLPGATGDDAFWQGVGRLLPEQWRKHYLSWPGLGMQAPSPNINSFSDLLDMVEHRLTVPSIIVAQSMGGVLAVQLALKRPELVTQLVMVATSGGLDVSAFGASDWRLEFLAAYPNTAPWLFSEKIDLTSRFANLAVPTLLIWGDADPISPVAVGRHLASVIPRSELAVISGGGHSMGAELPHLVAPLIEAHILKTDIS